MVVLAGWTGPFAVAVLLTTTPAQAWEAETTHAGLTERAALASTLHKVLGGRHGKALGLYELLTVPDASAPTLHRKLRLLPPTAGVTPDAGAKQTALGWLLAGSVLADVPAELGRHHFFDPVHGRGLAEKAAPEWIADDENDLGLPRFLVELEASATTTTRGERDRHLAFALLCAGAMAHVLEDMGSPSRVRDDLEAHLEPMGAGLRDHGSRYERLAVLMAGRLGLPDAEPPVWKPHLRDFFTSRDKTGLADVTARDFFSPGTLPNRVRVGKLSSADVLAQANQGLRFSSPSLPSIDLTAAVSPEGALVKNDEGVCLAGYRLERGQLGFSIPDACAAEQLAVQLPRISAYAAGLFDWLFRGELAVNRAGSVTTLHAVGKGNLDLLSEDRQGTRRLLQRASVNGGQAGATLARFEPPTAGTKKIIAVFRGEDDAGEPLVSVGEFGWEP